MWLTGLGPPPFETDPSFEAISDIQFVLKLPLRGPQGPDLINIFYGEPLDVAGSASGPVLIIVRAHYGWLCDDSDSEAWQWFMNASVVRPKQAEKWLVLNGTEIPDFGEASMWLCSFIDGSAMPAWR